MDVLIPTVLASSFDFLAPETLLEKYGDIGLYIIIFLESCFAPLPGDSLLFAAGLFSSEGLYGLNVWQICIGTFIAGVAGNQTGYWFGRKAGVALYDRPDSKLFRKDHLDKTHAYFERFGAKTIVIARFVPVVRGLAPIVAGVARMRYRTFVTYNIIGGFIWTFGFIIGGWFLGKSIPNVDKYVLPLVVAIIIVTSIPIVVEYYRARKHFANKPDGQANKVVEEEISPE